MQTFNIIKRNRKYFAAQTKSGHKCRILIDSNSEKLELGTQELVGVELTATRDIGRIKSPVSFLGYPLAAAKSRGYGATLESDVALIKGRATSGGSYKNWETVIESGTVLRLHIPSKLFENEAGTIGAFNYKVLNALNKNVR